MNNDKKFTQGVVIVSGLIVVGVVVLILRNRAKAKKAVEEAKLRQESRNISQVSTQQTSTPITTQSQTTRRGTLASSLSNIFSANTEAKKAKEKVTSQDVINANLFMTQLMLGAPR
jgi:hypothetical protein